MKYQKIFKTGSYSFFLLVIFITYYIPVAIYFYFENKLRESKYSAYKNTISNLYEPINNFFAINIALSVLIFILFSFIYFTQTKVISLFDTIIFGSLFFSIIALVSLDITYLYTTSSRFDDILSLVNLSNIQDRINFTIYLSAVVISTALFTIVSLVILSFLGLIYIYLRTVPSTKSYNKK